MGWSVTKPTVDDTETTIQLGSGLHVDTPVQVSIINNGPDECRLGPPGFTFANGYPLALNDQFACTITPGNTLVAKCDTGDTASLNVIKDQQSA